MCGREQRAGREGETEGRSEGTTWCKRVGELLSGSEGERERGGKKGGSERRE